MCVSTNMSSIKPHSPAGNPRPGAHAPHSPERAKASRSRAGSPRPPPVSHPGSASSFTRSAKPSGSDDRFITKASNSNPQTSGPLRDDDFIFTFDTVLNEPGQASQGPKATDPFERGGRAVSNRLVDARWLRSAQHYIEGTLLFNHTRAAIPSKKIWEYLLSTTNPRGRWKADLLRRIGYTTAPKGTVYDASPFANAQFRDDGFYLMSQIRENLRHRFILYTGKDPKLRHLKFTVNMVIRSPTGQVAWMETHWRYDLLPRGSENASPQPRLTTAIPHDREETVKFLRANKMFAPEPEKDIR